MQPSWLRREDQGSGKRVEGPLVSTLSAQMGEGPVCGAAVAGLMDELLQWVRVCGGSGDEDRRRWRDWVSCRAGMVVRVFFFLAEEQCWLASVQFCCVLTFAFTAKLVSFYLS